MRPILEMDIVCKRELTDGSNRIYQVVLGRPEAISSGEWRCPFVISGFDDSAVRYGHGVDGVQALQQALDGARLLLIKSGIDMCWLGGAGAGLARTVPTFFGPDFERHIEKLIDAEIQVFSANAKSKTGP